MIRFKDHRLRWVVNNHDYDFFTMLYTKLMYCFTVHKYSIVFNKNWDFILYRGRTKPKSAYIEDKHRFFGYTTWAENLFLTLPEEQRREAALSWFQFWENPKDYHMGTKFENNVVKDYDTFDFFSNTILKYMPAIEDDYTYKIKKEIAQKIEKEYNDMQNNKTNFKPQFVSERCHKITREELELEREQQRQQLQQERKENIKFIQETVQNILYLHE